MLLNFWIPRVSFVFALLATRPCQEAGLVGDQQASMFQAWQGDAKGFGILVFVNIAEDYVEWSLFALKQCQSIAHLNPNAFCYASAAKIFLGARRVLGTAIGIVNLRAWARSACQAGSFSIRLPIPFQKFAARR